MEHGLEEVYRAASTLAEVARGRSGEVATRAGRLAGRLADGRFHLSVIGEFKRGKSTVANALLRARILPTGVLPLTAVATEVRYGDPGATVVYLDGARRELSAGEPLDPYVTEEGNPANAAQVARVEVRAAVQLLESGLVLVDTPGVGSVHRHNDEAAFAAMGDGDGAVMVLSGDSPLSEREREIGLMLSERRVPVFFVLNKVDHLEASEVSALRRFVTDTLAAELGFPPRLWCVAALPALRARQVGSEPGPECGEFLAFESELTRWVQADLIGERSRTARQELAALAGQLDSTLDLAAASFALGEAVLAEKAEKFRALAAEHAAALVDDRLLLERDVEVLCRRLGANLAGFARNAPAEWAHELERVAATAAIGALEEELRSTVERAVRVGFDSFRAQEEEFAEQAWQDMAERQRSRVSARVNALREFAAELFEVPLPRWEVPAVSEERERFFYLFVHVGNSGEAFSRIGRRLLPPKLVRRRLLKVGKAQLVREFDKHAGRARWDLAQRLDSVRRRFEAAMSSELDATVDMILEAVRHAEILLEGTNEERQRTMTADALAKEAAAAALRACQIAPAMDEHIDGSVQP